VYWMAKDFRRGIQKMLRRGSKEYLGFVKSLRKKRAKLKGGLLKSNNGKEDEMKVAEFYKIKKGTCFFD